MGPPVICLYPMTIRGYSVQDHAFFAAAAVNLIYTHQAGAGVQCRLVLLLFSCLTSEARADDSTTKMYVLLSGEGEGRSSMRGSVERRQPGRQRAGLIR